MYSDLNICFFQVKCTSKNKTKGCEAKEKKNTLVVGRSCQDYYWYYSLVSRWTFCYHNYNNWISIPASLQIVLINSKRSLQFSQFILDYLFTSRCQTAETMCTLVRDQPVIPSVTFINWSPSIPYYSEGSLCPTYVSVRLLSLSVKHAYRHWALRNPSPVDWSPFYF